MNAKRCADLGVARVLDATLATPASAETVTIATFQDPSQDASQPMFSFDAIANHLDGSWTLPGLTLETIGGTFENVTFAMIVAYLRVRRRPVARRDLVVGVVRGRARSSSS